MMDWLIDTFIWTGALIALVLVIRRPVATWFGPKIAYALWALPFLRLLMPPLTLPAWMAPSEPVAHADAVTITVSADASVSPVQPADLAQAVPAIEPWFSVSDVLLPLWAGGSLAFLIWRWVDYRRMKDELLADAIPVGESGTVRLIESVAVNSPVAFGVRDKVIALPPGFISSNNTHARDLAIEHELQHHSGGDLLANFAAQAVLSLHWFNPLAWAGWRAMRRDQEAACDARVIEQRGQEERAAYGQVIAGFAAGPRLALAAPMACPVLGEKSVIHRLRSLNMSDVSTRRRIMGRAALLGSVLALPLTASVTYAEDTNSDPRTFQGKLEVVQPAPASATVKAFATADADAQEDTQSDVTVITREGDEEVEVIVIKDGDGNAAEKISTIVARAKNEKNDDGSASTFVWVEDGEDGEGDKKVKTITRSHSVFINSDKKMTDEERKELRDALAEARTEWRENGFGEKDVKIALAEAKGQITRVEMRCDGKKGEKVETEGDERTVFICKSEILASALTGMKAARDQIATNPNIPEEARGEALRSLDEEIRRIEKES